MSAPDVRHLFERPRPPMGPATGELARLHELVDWLVATGVCRLCAIGIGLFLVEREAKRRFDWQVGRPDCAHRDERGRSCKEIARAALPGMPKPAGVGSGAGAPCPAPAGSTPATSARRSAG